jgi:hypothetical protein
LIFSLDLLPVGIDDIQSGAICDTATVTSVQLVPIEDGSATSASGREHPASSQQWLRAFKQSAQHTLRSLSRPSQTGRYLIHGPNFDFESDITKSITSAVAMGLSLPKSPSVQSTGEEKDPTQQEREERGWWSFRFQQVLCELQMQSVLRD